MMMEEKLLHSFLKDNNLYDLEFAWGTNKDRYYIANNSDGEEVNIHYNVGNDKITLRS